ncbi:phage tail terminator family protein [Apilactobacillus xinyiensis]|uniref:phage tail terminator family protein n=1 Tax=Apilactobacillus xinyiensis TaxID=2841032 RepID=UPI00200F742E|nr:hypothetical protein [Apilactobacillus xinyiensis]MCL0330610.1 hypothetical protein [Apilactobacillus xinyiensis]
MIDVFSEIYKKLKQIEPDIKVYRNNIAGGVNLPAFFVQKIQTSVKPHFFSDQERSYYFQVTYLPDDNSDSVVREIAIMEDKLLDQFTQLDNFARVENREFKVNDSALNFTFSVEIMARYVKEETKQGQLDYEGGVKHG